MRCNCRVSQRSSGAAVVVDTVSVFTTSLHVRRASVNQSTLTASARVSVAVSVCVRACVCVCVGGHDQQNDGHRPEQLRRERRMAAAQHHRHTQRRLLRLLLGRLRRGHQTACPTPSLHCLDTDTLRTSAAGDASYTWLS